VRTDTQSKLDAILRRQRLGRAAAIVLALVIGAGIFYIQSQPNRSERELEAVVVKAFIDETPEGKRFTSKGSSPTERSCLSRGTQACHLRAAPGSLSGSA
jgi:hypothetical protein